MPTRELMPLSLPIVEPAASTVVLTRRLSALAQLSEGETEILESLARRQQHMVRAELCAEGEIPPPRMVISGWACRQRMLSDGRRQIISFILPGDSIGPLHWMPLPASCTTVALTPVVTVDAMNLVAALDGGQDTYPGLWLAVRRLALLQEIWLRDQIVRLGRRTAYERTVHLMLELLGRLDAVGLAEGDTFPLPLTQDVLADALGLSVVHVNRILGQVRRDGLFELRGGYVTIHRLELMETAVQR